MRKTAGTLVFGVLLLAASWVSFRPKDADTPANIQERSEQDRWALFEIRRIENRLKSRQITVAQAAELALPILQSDTSLSISFQLCPGENDFHRACHFMMICVEDHPNWQDFMEEYFDATGHWHWGRYAYDRLP